MGVFLGWRESTPVTPERSVLRARIVPSLEIRQYVFALGLTDNHKTVSFRFKEVSAAAFAARRSEIFAARLAPGKNERNDAQIKAASETVTSSTLASLQVVGILYRMTAVDVHAGVTALYVRQNLGFSL